MKELFEGFRSSGSFGNLQGWGSHGLPEPFPPPPRGGYCLGGVCAGRATKLRRLLFYYLTYVVVKYFVPVRVAIRASP